MAIRTFPQVFRSKEGSVAIVYCDRVEYYSNKHVDNKPQGSDFEKFNPFYEIDTCLKGNGFRHVNNHEEEAA